MKAVFYVVVVIAALIFGAKFYYEKQITQNLDQVATGLAPFADFTYEKASITRDGNISITGIGFAPKPEIPSVAFSIDELLLRTNNFMGLYELEKQLKVGDVPEHIGLSVTGLKISSDDLSKLNSEKTEQQLNFSGCGDIPNFVAYNEKSLKLSEIEMSMALDIFVPKATRSITFNASLDVEDLYALDVKFDIYSGVYGLDRESLPKLPSLAEFDGLSINYKDKGYSKGVVNFCADYTGMSKASYIAYHTNSWIKSWAKYELIPDAVMAAEYITFMESPEKFTLTMKPIGRLKLTEIADTPLHLLAFQLKNNLSVNGGAPTPITFSLTQARARALALQKKKDEPKEVVVAPEKPEAPAPEKISKANANYFLQRPINVSLKNGKSYTGEILLVTDKKIDLERKIGGGKFVMPILLDHIKSFELLD